MNSLDQLKALTKVVADTGDFEVLEKYKPQDATTNPTLILNAASQTKYKRLIDDAVRYGYLYNESDCVALSDKTAAALDYVHVLFGKEILNVIPGRVSTEVDPRLSFNKELSIKKAKRLISLYETMGVDRSRILIKLASTWEGIQAAKELEESGIHCNLTLLFSLPQAIACARAKVTLISPFVGRILDWYKKHPGHKEDYSNSKEDPGVIFVNHVYNYYKKFGYKTEIMGASFRNTGEIKELAGCDCLTISPTLLDELENSNDLVEKKLCPTLAKTLCKYGERNIDESEFRWQLNENEMANTLLSDGIRKFTADIRKLEQLLLNKIDNYSDSNT